MIDKIPDDESGIFWKIIVIIEETKNRHTGGHNEKHRNKKFHKNIKGLAATYSTAA